MALLVRKVDSCDLTSLHLKESRMSTLSLLSLQLYARNEDYLCNHLHGSYGSTLIDRTCRQSPMVVGQDATRNDSLCIMAACRTIHPSRSSVLYLELR